MFLIDRSESIKCIRKRVDELFEIGRVAIIGLVRFELLGGTRSEPEFRRLGNRLAALIDLGIINDTWEEAARLLF